MITQWTTEFITAGGARYVWDETEGILARLSERPIIHVGSSLGWDGSPTRACTTAPLELGVPARFMVAGIPLTTTPVTRITGRPVT